jgi:tetratricopeptide (TPR) repeat protein
MRSLLVSVGLACGFLMWAPSAQAQSGAGDRDQARAAFEQGVALVEQERWEEALERFDESLRLYPTQTALFNRGLCLGLMGRPVEAIRDLEEHVRLYGATVDAERRAQVDAELTRLRPRVARIEVLVRGATPATVLLDGVEAGQTPLARPLSVNPGRHQVTIRTGDREPESRWVTVGAGEQVSITIDPGAAAPPVSEGQSSEQPEDEPISRPPAEQPQPAPEPTPARGGGRLRAGGWASLGVGLAALGAAVALVLWNNSQFDTWESEDARISEALAGTDPVDPAELSTWVQDNDDLADTIATVDVVSWVLMAVGGAAAATSVVLLVLGYRAGRSSQVETAVVPRPGGLSLAMRW